MGITHDEKKERAECLAEQHGGIYAPTEIAYIAHISSVSDLAIRAFKKFEQQSNGDPTGARPDEIFESLQTALSHSAALSRFFWPTWNKEQYLQNLHSARGLKLRNAFRIEANCPLKDRGLRNAIEHYDEKLDLYHLDPQMGHIITMRIGSEPQSDDGPGFILLNVDTNLKVVNILGKQYEYGVVFQEVCRLSLLANVYMSSGARLPVQ